MEYAQVNVSIHDLHLNNNKIGAAGMKFLAAALAVRFGIICYVVLLLCLSFGSGMCRSLLSFYVVFSTEFVFIFCVYSE